MDDNSLSTRIEQPSLFELVDVSTGAVELFPAVWNALEELISPDVKVRHLALDRLLELNAPRFSPLVAYVLATRLVDPDLALRARSIQVLGELQLPDQQGRVTPDNVLRHLSAYLSQMRTRRIYCLLEAVEFSPGIELHIARLLNACPYAGSHLVEILTDRKILLAIRRYAVRFIGLVGYLDAIPSLEKLTLRLVARLDGQQSMPFAPPLGQDETELLPDIQNALTSLHAP